MQITWEKGDLSGGLVVKKAKDRELFILSWKQQLNKEPSHDYFLVSLSDGMVLHIGNEEEAISFLNSGYTLFNQIRSNRTVGSILTESR